MHRMYVSLFTPRTVRPSLLPELIGHLFAFSLFCVGPLASIRLVVVLNFEGLDLELLVDKLIHKVLIRELVRSVEYFGLVHLAIQTTFKKLIHL